MVTKFLNVSTDPTLSANSNTLVPSEKAVRAFIASKAIQLDFLQSTEPTTFSTGQKWLNTTDNKLYTATSSSVWDSGITVDTDQFFTYLDLLYYFDGTTINSYSSLSITEINQNRQIRRWLGTRAEYNALATKDPSVMYEVIEDSIDYALLASQEQFNNGENTVAATPYQVQQILGNYLSLVNGGNLAAGKTIGLANTNNEVSTLGYNTNGYITASNKLYVTGETSVNSLVARGGNIYKGSTSGATVLWSDTSIPATALPTATTTTLGGVKVDGSTILINNGVISASGTTISYDSALSTTSTNAVQNKIVTAAINGKISKSGDTMTGTLTMSGSGNFTITSDASSKQLKIYGTDTSDRLGGLVIDSNGSENVLYHHNGTTIYRLVDSGDKGVASGVASLDANAKVPATQIPAATSTTLGGVILEYDSTTNTLNIRTS